MTTERPSQNSELFPNNAEEINVIRSLYNNMIMKSIERLDENSAAEDLKNPAMPFTDYLKEKFAEKGIDMNPKDFGAYHYAIGSSLKQGDNVFAFDTEDNLVQRSLEEFAENY